MRKYILIFLPFFILTCYPVHGEESGPSGISLYSQALLEQINSYRKEHDLPPLRFDSRLIELAREHSFFMSQQKRLSHLQFNERFQRSGSRLCVENVGSGSTYALKQFRAWQASPDHDRNMLVADIHKAGIAEVDNYVTFFACQ